MHKVYGTCCGGLRLIDGMPNHVSAAHLLTHLNAQLRRILVPRQLAAISMEQFKQIVITAIVAMGQDSYLPSNGNMKHCHLSYSHEQ